MKLRVVSLSRSKVMCWAAQDLLPAPLGLKANVPFPFATLGCVLTFIFTTGFPFWFWANWSLHSIPSGPVLLHSFPPELTDHLLLKISSTMPWSQLPLTSPAPFACFPLSRKCLYLCSWAWQKVLDCNCPAQSWERCLHDTPHERLHQGWGNAPSLLNLIQDLK